MTGKPRQAVRPAACELCGRSGVRIIWEHCHAHNRHRGSLCDRCNAILREVDKGFGAERKWERAGERVWLYWLRCYRCARRRTASPFAFPAVADPEAR